MKIEAGKASVVNTFTGEVYDFEWDTVDTLKNAYLEIKSMKDSIDRAIKKMGVALEEFLGTDEEYLFPDGMRLKRYYRVTKEMRREDVAKYLDADQLDLVMRVHSPSVKEMFAELVNRGELPKDAYKDVENNSIQKSSTTYIRVIK